MLVLDVGCGTRPHGDVNLDLFPSRSQHRSGEVALDTKKIKNFVKGDCLHLPFKSNVFNIVYCFHVIEHLQKAEDPIKLIKELYRVAVGEVRIVCPHRFAHLTSPAISRKFPFVRFRQCSSHRYFFTARWFEKNLLRLRMKYSIRTERRLFPYVGILNLSYEIKVKITK